MSTTQPHVILIVSDQHNRKCLGCAGDPHVKTPNLDQLASAGTQFTAAYAPSPLCVPSRMAFLSGLSAMTTGIHHNSQTLPSHLPTIAHSMSAGGYDSVLCGRMHFLGPDQYHGFHERLVGDHGPTNTAHSEMEMGLFDGCTAQDGPTLAKSGGGWSSVQAFDQAVTTAAIDRMQQHTSSRPLFMTVGFYGPHNPYVCTDQQFTHYRQQLPPLSITQLDALRKNEHPAMSQWRNTRRIDGIPMATIEQARAAYYGAVESIDTQIGRLIAGIDQHLGSANCLVIYCSDHGDMAGERGLFWKSTFYEGSVGVPWIMRWPGHIATQQCSAAVSLLDLAPTLCDLLALPPLPAAEGQDLSPLLNTPSSPLPEPLSERNIISTLSDGRCGPSAMIRNGPWKLICYHGYDRCELYHLDNDPDEAHDLGQDPQHQQRLAHLRQHLMDHWQPEQVQHIATRSQQQLTLIRQAHAQTPEAPCASWQADPPSYHLSST